METTQNAAQHTPGPWGVGGKDKSGQRIVENEHIEICTCWHHSVGAIEKEMEANARLIAAAPDLLGALRFILAFYEPGQTYLDTNAWKQAEAAGRAAVAKAEANGS